MRPTKIHSAELRWIETDRRLTDRREAGCLSAGVQACGLIVSECVSVCVRVQEEEHYSFSNQLLQDSPAHRRPLCSVCTLSECECVNFHVWRCTCVNPSLELMAALTTRRPAERRCVLVRGGVCGAVKWKRQTDLLAQHSVSAFVRLSGGTVAALSPCWPPFLSFTLPLYFSFLPLSVRFLLFNRFGAELPVTHTITN